MRLIPRLFSRAFYRKLGSRVRFKIFVRIYDYGLDFKVGNKVRVSLEDYC